MTTAQKRLVFGSYVVVGYLAASLLTQGCAASLAERCEDRGNEILDEGERSGNLTRARQRLALVQAQCSYALEAMAQAEAVLEAP